MKSIKLKIVSWIIVLFMSVMSTFATDSIPPWGRINPESAVMVYKLDTTPIPLKLKTDPLELTFQRQPIEDNAPLQSMLECQNEQTDALNLNLGKLNKTASDFLQYKINERENTLSEYNIDPLEIQRKHNIAITMFAVLVSIWLILISILYGLHNKLYYEKSLIRSYVLTLVVSLFILYLLFMVITNLYIDGYYLWRNIDKLL